MQRRWALVVVIALAVSGSAVVPSAFAAHRSVDRPARGRPVLSIGSTLVGSLLVNGRGDTVFMFTKDKHNRDVCRTIKGCETDWPAVTTKGRLVLGRGINRKLVGTIPYKGKVRELTYDGRPLHTYKFDYSPESILNIGNSQFGGDWWALSPTATLVK